MARRNRHTDHALSEIIDRGRGKCHLCHKQLSYSNHGRRGRKGAWHVDHSKPLANGGTNHGNNLRTACIACNEEKATVTSRTAREWYGRRKAPLSHERYQREKTGNTIGGGAIGATIGGAIGGPPGALIGGLVGLAIGSSVDPDA